MRIMRADYNKPWRCPGWSGMHPAQCAGGSLAARYSEDSDKWKHLYKPHWTAYKCPVCDVRILPFILRWIEPAELWRMLKWKIRDWKYEREFNK